MANRMFFFIALPGTVICFVAYCMVAFTPNYVMYTAPIPDGMKDGDKVENYKMGAIQNCTKEGVYGDASKATEEKAEEKTEEKEEEKTEEKKEAKTEEKEEAKTEEKEEEKKTEEGEAEAKEPTDATKITYSEWDCSLLDWKILTNQIFLAYLSCTAVAFFTLLGAFLTGLVKIILDWVPHDKIKAARILCSRNFGLGLMSAHITAGGFIIASTVLMIVLWKFTLASAGWKLGMNIFIGIGIAIGSFFTAIMWFMDVKKMGLIPI